jgi:hypothetical protein
MRNIKLRKDLPFAVPEVIDITDKLPRKSSWETLRKKYTVKGVWDGKTYHRGFRRPEDITTIAIHHSGPPNGTLESHARYHAREWGAGIAYHIAIDGGLVKQVNDLLSFTYHSKGNNTYTVSIMVNRDLENSQLTDEERKLLYAAILTVKSLFPTITDIKGHNELPTCRTACPCTSMDRIRSDIAMIEQQIKEPKPDLNDELDNTENATTAKIFAAYSRFNDLYKLANTTGPNKEEAQRKCLQIAQSMIDAGILKQ